MTSPTELVAGALHAAATGIFAAAADSVAEDFIWHVPGRGSISGQVRGLQAWSDKLRVLVAAGLEPQLLAMLETNDRVAVVLRNQARADGRQLDVQVVNLFTVREDTVTRLDTFFSDQYAVDEFWSAVLPHGADARA